MLSNICRFLFVVLMRNLVLNPAAQVQTAKNKKRFPNVISKYSPWTENIKIKASTNVKAVPSQEEINVSPWISFAGCGNWSIDKFSTQTRVEETFDRIFPNDALRAENKYDCAFKCSSYEGATYIVYFKTVCQCIVNLDEELDTFYNYCTNPCSSYYDFYCQGDIGLLVFAIERNYTAQMEAIDNVPVHGVYSISLSTCLVIVNGVYITKQMAYCIRQTKSMQCNGNNNGIIFLLNNKYLQWICNELKDPLGKPYFRVLSRINNTSENTTTAFVKPDSITYMYTSTTTSVHAGVSRPDNYAIIICNCVLFLLVLLVWIVLYLKHFRQGKQVTKLNEQTSSTIQEQTSSTRQEQTSSTSQSSRISNYEQISEVIISHPFHITNETYSDICIPE